MSNFTTLLAGHYLKDNSVAVPPAKLQAVFTAFAAVEFVVPAYGQDSLLAALKKALCSEFGPTTPVEHFWCGFLTGVDSLLG